LPQRTDPGAALVIPAASKHTHSVRNSLRIKPSRK
jgi:hypothetical protein